ncbi:MAG TPA: SDR family NAD(P)-dependent oxidoreductase [Sphingobacteriaceae bacterium]
MKAISNQVILITGATDGLGKALAFRLAALGTSIILHGRDPEKGDKVLEELRRETGNNKLVYYNADFSSLDEVKQFANNILSSHQQLDILINNAGIGGGKQNSKREVSKDGFELRFAINYLAPFLLTHQLLPLLIKSEPSRIVNIGSGAQEPLDFTDLMVEKDYNGPLAYAKSKLALAMFTFTLAEKLKNHAICINCVHPASQMNTKMVIEADRIPKSTVADGVENVMYVVADPEAERTCGKFFNGKYPELANQQAYNVEVREKLYQLSTELVNL